MANEKDVGNTESKLTRLLKKDIWKARSSRSERAERRYRNSLRNAIISAISLVIGILLVFSLYIFSVSLDTLSLSLFISSAVVAGMLIGIGFMFSIWSIVFSANGLWRKRYPGPETRASAKKGFALACLVLACVITFHVYLRANKDFSYRLILGRAREGPAEFTSKHYSWQRQLNKNGYFFGISGVDPKHIWAVGTDGVVFFNGKKWVPQYREYRVQGDIARSLSDVFALDSKHVWAVGERKTVLYFDGLKWNKMLLPDNISSGVDVSSVSGLASDDVYAVGSPYLFFLNGSTWSVAPVDAEGHCNSVSARGPACVWVAGNDKFLLSEGTGWKEMPNDIGEFPHAICVSDQNHVWVAAGNAIYFFDGVSWHKQVEYKGVLTDIYALGNADVWAVGWEDHLRGKESTQSWHLYHFDGSTWEQEYRSPEVIGDLTNVYNNMSGVYSPDPDHVWVVGDGILLGVRKEAK